MDKFNYEWVEKRPIHETFTVGALLAVVGGFLDAYTYILRGGVFANAQTGNIVLLAVNSAQGNGKQAMYYLAPITAFILGISATEFLKKKYSHATFMAWEHMILLLEIALLLVVGFIPQSVSDDVVNVMISFICSIQVNSFRKIKGMTYASTMCTGNLRSGTENIMQYFINKDEVAGKKAAHYFGIIILFIIGAILGAIFSDKYGVRSVWICCVALLLVFCLMLGGEHEKKRQRSKRKE
ncbi:MAG: YoaK family protein [Lachnospiraceae bacterium]